MFNFVALDLETTGLDSLKDEIIEIGMVKFIDFQEAECYSSLVRPKGSLSVKIKRLTGLQDDDFKEAPELIEILPVVKEFIADLPLVGHNIKFDSDFLSAAVGYQLKNELYDTLELARYLLPAASSHRLGDLCNLLNIEIVNQHRALDDAVGSAHLVKKLLDQYCNVEPSIIWQLSQLLKQAHSTWYPILESLSSEIVKKFPNRKITVKNPGAPKLDVQQKEKKPQRRTVVSLDECTNILGPDGILATTLPRFRYRPQQCDMMEQVLRGLNENKTVLVEAGTGTGKSLAYLVPAIQWARKNDERVLVTTHTITLQEQLCNKDIPLLRNLRDFEFSAALLKGRGNYLCLRRWYALMSESYHQPEEASFLAKILVWIQQTTTGDKSELAISYQEIEYWHSICSESDGCLGNRCRYFSEMCFFMAAKRKAELADVVFVNHSLLLSDANTENMVLPSYGPLIIDEAHHLESCATEHLGRMICRSDVLRWLSATSKMLNKLEHFSFTDEQDAWSKLVTLSQETRSKCRESAVSFFEMLARWVEAAAASGEGRYSLRFTVEEGKNGISQLPIAVDSELDNLIVNLKTLCQNMVRVTDRLTEAAAFDERVTGISRDISAWLVVGQDLIRKTEWICRNHQDEYVYWVEAGGSFSEVVLKSAPIDVGPLLYETLFKEPKPIILTSATLSVDGTFKHYRNSIGLNFLPEEQVIEKVLDSPFNYGEQALLCVTKDISQPIIVGENVYHDELAKAIYRLSLASGGRTLVLFTSHRSLREVYHRTKGLYEDEDICLIGHELDGSRRRLVEQFMNGKRMVLFGAASFWEGVDVPGEALSTVIIVKLPFSPPNHPVLQARLETIAKQGRNGFQEYQIPQAVIKFKQGFGRLIRDISDKGTVVILDGRIVEKRYGKKFFNSLPLSEHFRGNVEQVVTKVRSWLRSVDD